MAAQKNRLENLVDKRDSHLQQTKMGPRGKNTKQPDQPTIEDDVKTNAKTLNYFTSFFFVT